MEQRAMNKVMLRVAGTIQGRYLAAACGAIWAAGAWGQLSVGPNVNISRQTGDQTEGAIAINPTNPLNLFALYNDLTAGMRGAVSTNGGATWVTRAVGTGGDGLSASIGDPSVAFDNFGNLFLCHLTSSGIFTQVGLSTNGGNSFTTLTTVALSTDQPTVTAGAGSVWVTCNNSNGQRLSGAAVTGLGVVGGWSALSPVAPGSATGISGSFGDVCIGPGGKVAIVYQNANSGEGPDSIYFNLDADGLGAGGMGPRSTITSTNVGGFDHITPQPSRSIDAEAGLAWDRTGGMLNGRLYLVYTEETVNENNDTNIMFRFSDNNGTTWSSAVKLNDDVTARSQFLPRISIDPLSGHLAVVWYDCRNFATNNVAQIYGTASMDGGATWLPNARISAGASTAGPGGFDFGDYAGLTMYNDVFYPIWADNSNSTSDNPNGVGGNHDQYTAKVSVCYANCDLSTTAPTLNVLDFACFLNKYAAGDPYANCDNSTVPPVLNVLDFSCFLNKYAAGCT